MSSYLQTQTEVNGHNGDGHRDGHHNGHRRRRRPQIRNGVRLAAVHANAGLRLVRELGFTVHAAAQGTGSNPADIAAMGTLHDFGDIELLNAALTGEVPFRQAAARVKPLVKAEKAFNALSIADQIEFARRENPERLFDDVIVPASEPPQVNLVL